MKVISTNNAKTYILDNLNQIKILSHYLGILESHIEYCLKRTTNRICNPLRNDREPSLGCRYYSTNSGVKLIVRDFGNSYYSGDIFDIAGIALGKNPFNPKEFIDIIFDILRTQNDKSNYYISIQKKIDIKTSNDIQKIEIQPRTFTLSDYKYWAENGITPEYISKGKIIAINRYWKNGYPTKYLHHETDPCYCYYLGTKNDFDIVKLYFPYRTKREQKFDTNCTDYLEAPHELTIKDDLLICKARKDKLLIMRIIDDLGYNVCITNASSERMIPNRVVSVLKQNYINIYSLFDFDDTGIEVMKEMFKKYGIIHPSFSPVILNKLNGVKDLSDYCRINGYNQTKVLFESIYNNLITLTHDNTN